MFKKLGFQVYTVRDFMKDEDFIDLTFKKLSEFGYTEAHTAGVPIAPEKFADLTKKNGISIIGTHYDFNKILNQPENTMELHRMWGTTNVGVGAMPGPARIDLDELKKFISDFNKASQLYAKNGFKLTYHNHHFEFCRIDGTKTLMDYLYEGLDKDTTSFVLDTCWAAAGGGDVREWLEKLSGRIDILHLKDMQLVQRNGCYTADVTEIGNGTLYWKGILETAEKIGVKHYIVEQDTNFIRNNPVESLRASAEFLKQYMVE